MPFVTITKYVIRCDICGKIMKNDNHIISFATKKIAQEYAEQKGWSVYRCGWIRVECPECYDIWKLRR